VLSRFENASGSSFTVGTMGTVGQGGSNMGSDVQDETDRGDLGPTGDNSSLVLAAIKERQETPQEFIKLYRGGARTKLQRFIDPGNANHLEEILSDHPGDFAMRPAIYFMADEEVAENYTKIRRRMDDKLDQKYGVLSIHIKKPQHTVVDGDSWKEASIWFF
jgi:hypothetical protein